MDSNGSLQNNPPRHVAIIMDGNGRWAERHGLTRLDGHREGAKSVRAVVEEARRTGIQYLTLYAFSTENWERPEAEVSALMELLCHYLESELELFLSHNIRLRVIGDHSRLPLEVRQKLEETINKTAAMNGMDLILALSYGGRQELVNAVRRIGLAVQRAELDPDAIDQDLVRKYLYAPDVPDPDLLIRTSGENRISNFLLWQIAYAEIVIRSEGWPEFRADQFKQCIGEYAIRERRFGRTSSKLNSLALGDNSQ